jgi:hypothetical protein
LHLIFSIPPTAWRRRDYIDLLNSSEAPACPFLNIAHRSTFENANILILLEKKGLISKEILGAQLGKLETLCRQKRSFQKELE